MSLVTVFESAIQARAATDGTLTALVGGTGLPQFTNVFGPLTLTTPYVVYQVSETDVLDTFEKRASNVDITFYVFDKVANGVTGCNTILVRLLGDWPAQSNRTPTFGFDRWTPDLSSAGWSGGMMIKTGGSTAHERDMLCYMQTYKAAASFL